MSAVASFYFRVNLCDCSISFGSSALSNSSLLMIPCSITMSYTERTSSMGFLSYFSTLLVTDDWVQGGNDTDTVLYHFVATLFVYGDTEDALRGQGLDGVLQPCQTLEEAFCDDWFHYVQLQLPCLCSKAVVASFLLP